MENTIIAAVSDVLNISANAETSMENTPEWDSLKTLQIIMALDEAGVSIPLEKIPEIRSAADLVRFAEGGNAD